MCVCHWLWSRVMGLVCGSTALSIVPFSTVFLDLPHAIPARVRHLSLYFSMFARSTLASPRFCSPFLLYRSSSIFFPLLCPSISFSYMSFPFTLPLIPPLSPVPYVFLVYLYNSPPPLVASRPRHILANKILPFGCHKYRN